ncbi:MAG: hypothetical protein Q4D37_10160 [Oscillospiraceae bacterium]|nr:hypothetical protein [Oscillospiraceae bacterium]
MNHLKQLIFESAIREHFAYIHMLHDGRQNEQIVETQHQRYLAVHNIIRLGFMEDEYKQWYCKNCEEII